MNQFPMEFHHHSSYHGAPINSGLHSNYPSHASQTAHPRFYDNPTNQFTNSMSSLSASSIANQGRSSNTTASHKPDEEAAATALLMSAGGQHRNEFETHEVEKYISHQRNDSTDGKSISEVFHVSPSSNEGLHEENNGEVGDHDSIQGELRRKEDITTIDDFPSRLHQLLTCGDFSSVAHWMPGGKSWRVVNWHEFSNAMPKYFPKFCENDRGENASVMNRMNSFLNEVQVWGFEKERDETGVVCYCHEVRTDLANSI